MEAEAAFARLHEGPFPGLWFRAGLRARARLVDLVGLVVRRTYRCKDREYVRVARAVDGDELRDRLHRAKCSDNPAAQLHASYVLWLLDRPAIANTRHVWRTWLSGTRTWLPVHAS
ncbi:hypothetical protein [Streptomyces sp. BK340]|uniref:hypothetical protein n=1 Tax=Streptomyces sp. BK340 TaxID=2572903 RepID=UPI0011AC7329|nr:hypothetical protein [Streptomyces sp. BK340]TVZ95057.1 hypothetical protein FB157_104161 [Streptomyces sp. BK340]